MRAKEFVSESTGKFPDEFLKPAAGIKRYDGLDNSSPYMMWRFLVAAAGFPDGEHTKDMDKKGPIGQKMATLAYTDVDAQILDATASFLGAKGTELSSQDSTEPDYVNKVSTAKPFAGYKRR